MSSTNNNSLLIYNSSQFFRKTYLENFLQKYKVKQCAIRVKIKFNIIA